MRWLRSQKTASLASAAALLAQLKALMEEAQNVLREARRKRDAVHALAGIRELARLLELAAKLTGRLDGGGAPALHAHLHLEADHASAVLAAAALPLSSGSADRCSPEVIDSKAAENVEEHAENTEAENAPKYRPWNED
jgi:hypothetical protein